MANFPLKQIANFKSEALVFGAVTKQGDVISLKPDEPAELGDRIA